MIDNELAIEFQGTFWHSDGPSKGMGHESALIRHQEKQRLCELRGIRLIFVWQDDWEERRDAIRLFPKESVGWVSASLLG